MPLAVRVVFELLVFGAAVVALWAACWHTAAIVMAVAVMVSELLLYGLGDPQQRASDLVPAGRVACSRRRTTWRQTAGSWRSPGTERRSIRSRFRRRRKRRDVCRCISGIDMAVHLVARLDSPERAVGT